MEKQDTPKIEIIKARSNVACLRDGLSFPLLHFTEIVRFLWPLLLVFGVFYTVAKLIEQHLLLGASASLVPSTQTLGLVGGLELLSFLLLVVLSGAVLYQQRHLTEKGHLPHARVWTVWREMQGPVFRMLVGSIIGILFLASSAVAFVLASLLHLPWCYLAGVALLVLYLIQVPALLEYSYTDISYLKAIRQVHLRYFGRAMTILFVAGLVTVLCLVIIALPFALVASVDAQVFLTHASGDVAVLPSAFLAIRAVSVLIYILLSTFVSLLMAYPLQYHWGSTKAFEQERQAYLSAPQ